MPLINIPGHMLMKVPELTINQAIEQFDIVVANMRCENRNHRMILERSVLVLQTLVDGETKRMIAEQQAKAIAEAEKAKADASNAGQAKDKKTNGETATA